MGCIGSRNTPKELPKKDYDRKLVKRRRLLAGVVIKKGIDGIEADIQAAYVHEKDDTYKSGDAVEANTSELPAIEYIEH